MKPTRGHWEQCKIDNLNLILQSEMQIKMAKRILILADEEINKFPIPKDKVKIGEPKLKSVHRK